MKTDLDTALLHIDLRIALAGEGWSTSRNAALGIEASACLPGGSRLDFMDDGEARLFDRFSRPLGRGQIERPEFFASLMHNVDVMINAETRQRIGDLTMRLADAIADHADCDLKDYLLAGVQREGGVSSAVEAGELLVLMQDFASRNEGAREAMLALEWIRKSSRDSGGEDFDDWRSLVRWAGRVRMWEGAAETIQSVNGQWEKLVCQNGYVEAARSLGTLEGRISGGHAQADGRQVYALRMPEDERIVAVAVFQDGDLASVLKHVDPESRPQTRIHRDIAALVSSVGDVAELSSPAI